MLRDVEYVGVCCASEEEKDQKEVAGQAGVVIVDDSMQKDSCTRDSRRRRYFEGVVLFIDGTTFVSRPSYGRAFSTLARCTVRCGEAVKQ